MSTKINPLKLFILYFLPSILWATVIFHASSYPTAQVSPVYWQEFTLKKMAHLFVYSVLTALNYRALLKSGVRKKEAGLIAIFVTFLYGLSDEFHQSFTPTREPTIRDAIIDTIGGSATILYIWKLLPKAPEKLLSLGKALELV